MWVVAVKLVVLAVEVVVVVVVEVGVMTTLVVEAVVAEVVVLGWMRGKQVLLVQTTFKVMVRGVVLAKIINLLSSNSTWL